MQPIPIPCVASSGGVRLVIIAIYCTVDHAGTIHLCSRYRCRVWHLLEVTGIYAADTDTMSGILDAHAVDTDTMCGIFWR